LSPLAVAQAGKAQESSGREGESEEGEDVPQTARLCYATSSEEAASVKLSDFLQHEAESSKGPQVDAGCWVAQQQFQDLGVDLDEAIETALNVPVSVHCWQADDVRGLERREGEVDSGGLQATGGYPGAARTGDEIEPPA